MKFLIDCLISQGMYSVTVEFTRNLPCCPKFIFQKSDFYPTFFGQGTLTSRLLTIFHILMKLKKQ